MYSFTERVRFSEVNENRKVSLVAIINFFQDCCTFESEDGGVGLDWLYTHHTAWMLTNWQIKILKRPEYAEKIRITTWACGFRLFIGKRSFKIEDEKTRELLVYAVSEWAYVNTLNGIPCKDVPQKELDVYGYQEPIELPVDKGRINIREKKSWIKLPCITVAENNLDTNHHVNNGQYISIAVSQVESMIPPGSITELRAEYKAQSKLGDILYPEVSIDDRSCIVILKDGNGKEKLITELKGDR